ncbi:MAG: hypothetical protein AMXMBFR81_28930 [Chthonomonas sp.]
MATLWLVGALWACGGSGGTDALTTRDVSNSVAGATNLTQMTQAFGNLYTVLAMPADSPLRQVYDSFIEPTLNSRGAQLATFQSVYDNLEARLAADPRSEDFTLNLTAQEFLDIVNPRLPAAYAAQNNPANAPYVLFSSRPGQIPPSAPVVSTTDRLTLFQIMMFTEVRGRIFAELNPIEPPPAAGAKGSSGVGLGTASECTEACEEAFATCGQTCLTQFQTDQAEAIATFKAFVSTRIALVVIAIGAVQTLSSYMISLCEDQECVDNINNAVAWAMDYFPPLLEAAVEAALETYSDEIANATRDLEQCGTACENQLGACLDACHNQGGG